MSTRKVADAVEHNIAEYDAGIERRERDWDAYDAVSS